MDTMKTMNILALDTATTVMGVALLQNEKVLAAQITNQRRNHAEQLLNVVQNALASLQWEPSDIDMLAVSRGPGSYTGVRIGVTVAKTFSWALGIPLYSESTLRLLAENGNHFSGLVVPLIDARRSRVYAAAYRRQNDRLEEVLSQQVWPIDCLLTELENQEQPVLFLGEDVSLYTDAIVERRLYHWDVGVGNENMPQPGHLGRLAWEQWLRLLPPEPIDFAPQYLQLTEAENKWLEQQKKK